MGTSDELSQELQEQSQDSQNMQGLEDQKNHLRESEMKERE